MVTLAWAGAAVLAGTAAATAATPSATAAKARAP
jgi:hypothetical protein